MPGDYQAKPLDSFSPHLEHPYPWYAQLRRQPPVYDPPAAAWLISRYADVRWVLEQSASFSARDTLRPPTPPPASVQAILADYPPAPALMNSDGEQHRQLRALVETAFRPCLHGMRTMISAQAQALVDRFIADGQADLIRQFAQPLAFGVLLALLAIPLEDQPAFRHLSDETLTLMASLVSPAPLSEERQVAYARSYVQLQHWLGVLVARRRTSAGDDLISRLARASIPGLPPLAAEAVVALLVDLLLGGYMTTAALIGTSVQLLLTKTNAWQTLRAHPEQRLLVVEEALRYDAPVQAMVRTTTEAVILPGTTKPVPPDTQVLLLYGAANRDPAAIARAEVVDLQRRPTPHLAFGHGVHACVGAPLARLEVRIALETLLRCLPSLHLAAGQDFAHVPTLLYRSLARLNVRWP